MKIQNGRGVSNATSFKGKYKDKWEVRWPHCLCTHLQMDWPRFKSWLGTLCCVLGQDTLLSQCLSPPRCINGYRQTQCWGNPAMDGHSFQEVRFMLQKLETGPLGSHADFTIMKLNQNFLRGSNYDTFHRRGMDIFWKDTIWVIVTDIQTYSQYCVQKNERSIHIPGKFPILL